MSKKACVNCGTFFSYIHSNKKFCTDTCRWSYNDRRKTQRNNKPQSITLPYIPDKYIEKEK